jgi:hypothetical protein
MPTELCMVNIVHFLPHKHVDVQRRVWCHVLDEVVDAANRRTNVNGLACSHDDSCSSFCGSFELYLSRSLFNTGPLLLWGEEARRNELLGILLGASVSAKDSQYALL